MFTYIYIYLYIYNIYIYIYIYICGYIHMYIVISQLHLVEGVGSFELVVALLVDDAVEELAARHQLHRDEELRRRVEHCVRDCRFQGYLAHKKLPPPP